MERFARLPYRNFDGTVYYLRHEQPRALKAYFFPRQSISTSFTGRGNRRPRVSLSNMATCSCGKFCIQIGAEVGASKACLRWRVLTQLPRKRCRLAAVTARKSGERTLKNFNWNYLINAGPRGKTSRVHAQMQTRTHPVVDVTAVTKPTGRRDTWNIFLKLLP